MPETDLISGASFRHWTPVAIRFCDQDSLARVNNVALAASAKAACTAYVYELIAKGGTEGLEFILPRVVIDFHREPHYPGAVKDGDGEALGAEDLGPFVEGQARGEAASCPSSAR